MNHLEPLNSTISNFEHFYKKSFDEFFVYTLTRTGNREVAMDICQESFTKLWNELHTGKKIDNLHGFFYRILGNKIIDFYRKKKSLSLDELREQGYEPVLTESTNDQLEIQTIVKKLEKLSDTYRDIVIMRFITELSVAEISKRTGLSENVISVRLHRGKLLAQEILQSNWDEYQQ